MITGDYFVMFVAKQGTDKNWGARYGERNGTIYAISKYSVIFLME